MAPPWAVANDPAAPPLAVAEDPSTFCEPFVSSLLAGGGEAASVVRPLPPIRSESVDFAGIVFGDAFFLGGGDDARVSLRPIIGGTTLDPPDSTTLSVLIGGGGGDTRPSPGYEAV